MVAKRSRIIFTALLTTTVLSCSWGSASAPTGVGSEAISEFRGVPVVRESLQSPIDPLNPTGRFAPPAQPGRTSEVQALEAAWRALPVLPHRFLVAELDWRDSPSWKGGTVWLVSFQGGDVCVPVYGGPTTTGGTPSPGCASVIENVILDAANGERIIDFSRGPRGDVGSDATRSLTEILRPADPG